MFTRVLIKLVDYVFEIRSELCVVILVLRGRLHTDNNQYLARVNKA